MAWNEPRFTREQVNRAAKDFLAFDITSDDWTKSFDLYNTALPIINNWRSAHSYPLNTFQVTLRNYSRRVDASPLIAQRIKRLSSIEAKLRREPSMRLSQMQDIGGCRSVLSSVDNVRALMKLYKESGIKHEQASMDDYMSQPKVSGYRGVHLVYRYVSDKNKKAFNGLKIEIQLRSQYQHAWATAVETVGTFVQQALKSSLGEPDWLRFFVLMGSAIAMRENTEPVPDTPKGKKELVAELEHLANSLNVAGRLNAYGLALKTLGAEQKNLVDAHYYLLVLNPTDSRLTVRGFPIHRFTEASEAYLEEEKKLVSNPGNDAVLVSVDSLTVLERAYPNYFADTRMFLVLLDQTLKSRPRAITIKPRVPT